MTQIPRTASALLAVAAMLTVGLAGCVGSSGGPGPLGGNSTANTTDPANGNRTDLPTGVDPAGLRPHVHDRWGDRETIAVIDDQTVRLDTIDESEPDLMDRCDMEGAQKTDLGICFGGEVLYPDQKSDAETQIVPPGTEKVTVTLTFEESRVGSLMVLFQNAEPGATLRPLGEYDRSGMTRAVRDLSIRQSDGGHAKVSKWRFAVHTMDNWDPAPVGTPGVYQGPHPQGLEVTVSVVAHRVEGELPIEPPHPVYWEGTDFYRVAYTYGEVANTGGGPGFVHAGPAALRPDGHRNEDKVNLRGEGIRWRAKPGAAINYTQLGSSSWKQPIPEPFAEDAVPPRSEKILAKVAVSGESNVGVDVCLYGKFSTQQSKFGQQMGCFQHSGPGSASEVYEMALKDNMLDSPYAGNNGENHSRWTWTVQITGQGDEDRRTAGDWSGSVQVAVFVTTNLEFEMPAWAFEL